MQVMRVIVGSVTTVVGLTLCMAAIPFATAGVRHRGWVFPGEP